MKVVVFTLGCKVNECESDSLIAGLAERGYEVSDKLEKADLYIVNTCAVTKEAEKKSRQTQSRILKLNPEARIIYTGCAVEKCPEKFADKEHASLVVGTFGKGKILDLLDKEGTCIFEHDTVFEDLTPIKTLRTRAFIKVQDGCDNFCSYCIIPYLRGRSRSRSIEKIREEISLSKAKEIVLTGINLSDYNYNGKGLYFLIENLTDFDVRIRLGSLEVGVIDDRLLTALLKLKNFAPHFHLSLQSGSNNVLKKMNRHYSSEEYAEKVDLIRKYFPFAGITTDIIVGFPTETEEDFNETVALVERIKFSDIHPFIFSPREGTVAYKMKDIDAETKKRRAEKLAELKAESKKAFIELNKNRELDFLFEENTEGFAEGYSENYIRLYISDFADNGKIRKVKIKEDFKDGAIAEVLK